MQVQTQALYDVSMPNGVITKQMVTGVVSHKRYDWKLSQIVENTLASTSSVWGFMDEFQINTDRCVQDRSYSSKPVIYWPCAHRQGRIRIQIERSVA